MGHPDDRCCAVEMPDGFAHVLIPNWEKFTLDPEEEGKEFIADLDGFIDRVCVKNLWAPDADAARAMPRVHHLRKDVPPQRAFLAARKLNAAGDGIEIDMARARAIRTDLIRPERNARLLALDADYMIADEAGDSAAKAAVAAKKQALRDLPANIQPDLDAIADPEALEAWQPVWPE